MYYSECKVLPKMSGSIPHHLLFLQCQSCNDSLAVVHKLAAQCFLYRLNDSYKGRERNMYSFILLIYYVIFVIKTRVYHHKQFVKAEKSVPSALQCFFPPKSLVRWSDSKSHLCKQSQSILAMQIHNSSKTLQYLQ